MQLPGSNPKSLIIVTAQWDCILASCTKICFMGELQSPPVSHSDCSDNVITFRLTLVFLRSSYRIKISPAHLLGVVPLC